MTDNVNNKFNLGIQRLGMTSDNRHLYLAPDPDSNKMIKISVSDKDNDTFEKTASKLNEFAQEGLNPENLKKKNFKAYATFIGLGLAGIAIPSYLTRNSKKMTKVLSIGAGIVLGVTTGFFGFLKCLMPKFYNEAKVAAETMKTLDIRKEK